MLDFKIPLLFCMITGLSSCMKKNQTEYDFKDFKMADENALVEDDDLMPVSDDEYIIKLRVVRRSNLM